MNERDESFATSGPLGDKGGDSVRAAEPLGSTGPATLAPDECQHKEFEASVDVNRYTEGEGGAVESFNAEIKIRCKRCLTQFKFLGLGIGMMPTQPMTDVGGTELRAPIVPVGREDMIAQVGYSFRPGIPTPKAGLTS